MGNGLYVACWLTPEDADMLAIGGEPPDELHLTLLYLGDLDELPENALTVAQAVTSTVAASHAPVSARVAGVGVFRSPDRDCLIALIDAPDLECLRDCLWEALDEAGLEPVANHGFQPHVTLAYLEPDQTVQLPPSVEVTLKLASVSVGIENQERADFPLMGLRLAKEQPTSDSVHVDRPLGSDEKKAPKKKRRRRRSHVAAGVRVMKADDEQQVVYGIVLQPDVDDSQGDVMEKSDIEATAWRFLYNRTPLGLQHAKLAPDSVRPVESYLAPCDFVIETPRGPEVVTKGSWVVAAHVPDPHVWEDVKKGVFDAWSIAGRGVRTPIAD